MLRTAVLLVCAAFLAPVGLAQTRVEVADPGKPLFSTGFEAGRKLKLHVRSGEIRIIGTSENRISVDVSGANAHAARKVKVRFERGKNSSELRVCGGPRSDLTITIRIPSDTDLYARVPFGEVHVENLTNNQDVELHAGELTIDVGDAADYAQVHASVLTGELDAEPFDESRAGLFRSFKTKGNGRYRLHAHVGAGELTLQ